MSVYKLNIKKLGNFFISIWEGDPIISRVERMKEEMPRSPARWVGRVAVPLSQEDNALAFGHREEELTSPSSPKTVSTSQNAGMPRWPLRSGTTW